MYGKRLVRDVAGIAVATAMSLGMAGVGATAASASVASPSKPSKPSGCQPEPGYPWFTYKHGKVTSTWKATSLKSDWLHGPGTITYTSTRTATVGGSITGGLGKDKAAIFKFLSVKLDITGNGSYAWGHSWSYSKPVPSGRIARLVMYHQMRKFKVYKYRWWPPICGYKYDTSGNAIAARKLKTANTWKLQYQ